MTKKGVFLVGPHQRVNFGFGQVRAQEIAQFELSFEKFVVRWDAATNFPLASASDFMMAPTGDA